MWYLIQQTSEWTATWVTTPNIKLYIQPGGDAYEQQHNLGPEGRKNILDYLDNHNGLYLGICAGFFYSAASYYWQGILYNHPYLLGRFPTLEGPITDIANWPNYALTRLSNGIEAIYYGGPTRGYRLTPADLPGEVKATFVSVPGNPPAVLTYRRMLLTSVHLEAYENEGVTGLSTAQRVENYRYLAHLIDEVAEMNHVGTSADTVVDWMLTGISAQDIQMPPYRWLAPKTGAVATKSTLVLRT